MPVYPYPERAASPVLSVKLVPSKVAGLAILPGSAPRIAGLAGQEISKDGECSSHETKNGSRNTLPCADGMRSVAIVDARHIFAWPTRRHGSRAFDQ